MAASCRQDETNFPRRQFLSPIILNRLLAEAIHFRNINILSCAVSPGKPPAAPCRTPAFLHRNRVIFHDLSLSRPEPYRHLFPSIHDNLRIRSSGPGAALAPIGVRAPFRWNIAPCSAGDRSSPHRGISDDPAFRHNHDATSHLPAPLPPGEHPRRRAGDP